MIIEFQNTIEPKNYSAMAMAIVITACAFFFIPTTLIILGYYSSQPTGTLISPIPEGTLSEVPTSTPTDQVVPSVTPEVIMDNQPIVASDNSASESANSEVVPEPSSNITDKVATIPTESVEVTIEDTSVTEETQIYLSPRLEDSSIYSVKSKTIGQFTIAVNNPSDTVRYIDYHIVNP